MRRLLLLLLLLLLTVPLFAADPSIDGLSWMAGHWSDGTVEELWLAPKGELMLGVNRTIAKNGKAAFEFLRIAKTADGIAYLAQPSGKPPTTFKLVELAPGRAVFANPENDFPKRVVYELRDGKLCARVDSGEDSGGEEWCWSRVKP